MITVEAEFDLTDPELIGTRITDRDTVEQLVKHDVRGCFEFDEGFVSLIVTCSDY